MIEIPYEKKSVMDHGLIGDKRENSNQPPEQ